ncbi:MAG: DUF3008 family protein [Patescibacteria group bacterium]
MASKLSKQKVNPELSESRRAAASALLVKQGKRPESRLKGDAKELYESMTEEELRQMASEDNEK